MDAQMTKYGWDASCRAANGDGNCLTDATNYFEYCMQACPWLYEDDPEGLGQCLNDCGTLYTLQTSNCSEDLQRCLEQGERNYKDAVNFCDQRYPGGMFDWDISMVLN